MARSSGGCEMVHFSDPQDTSLVLKYLRRNCTSGDENLGNQSIGTGFPKPPPLPGGLLEERLSGRPAIPSACLSFWLFQPQPTESLASTLALGSFACIRNESQADAHTPALVPHLPHVPSRVLSAAGGPRNGRTHHWPMSQFRFYQEDMPQGSSEVLPSRPLSSH